MYAHIYIYICTYIYIYMHYLCIYLYVLALYVVKWMVRVLLDTPVARCEANTMVVVRKRFLHVQLLWAYARSSCAARGIYSYTFIGRLGCLIWHHYSCATKEHRLIAQCRCQHQWAGVAFADTANELGCRILINHRCYILKFWLVEMKVPWSASSSIERIK